MSKRTFEIQGLTPSGWVTLSGGFSSAKTAESHALRVMGQAPWEERAGFVAPVDSDGTLRSIVQRA